MAKTPEELKEYKKLWLKNHPGYSNEYYKKNKDRALAHRRKYAATDKGKLAARSARLKRTYGISLDDYENILREQNGVCAICKGPSDNKSGNFDIDHDHVTKKVRGLLCHACNVMVGMSRENKDILATAILYLEKSS